MTDFSMAQTEQNEITVFEIKGVLNIGALEQLQARINDLLVQGKKKILIDFSNIDRISSLGLGVLIAICKNITKASGSLALCSLKKAVMDVFYVTRLAGIFNIFKDKDDAINAFERGFETQVETSIRRFKRIKTSIKVESRRAKQEDAKKIKGETVNIEHEGVFVKGIHSYEKNDILQLTINLPEKHLTVLGRVAWVAEKGKHPDFYPGIGIHFINIDDNIKKMLSKYILESEE